VQALIWIEHPGSAVDAAPRLLEAAAIVGAAFLGGYLFTLRTLLRAVMNFELSPITWLRAASTSSPARLSRCCCSGRSATRHSATCCKSPARLGLRRCGLWLAVAFVAGYVPDRRASSSPPTPPPIPPRRESRTS
jgi:hypothetical protein